MFLFCFCLKTFNSCNIFAVWQTENYSFGFLHFNCQQKSFFLVVYRLTSWFQDFSADCTIIKEKVAAINSEDSVTLKECRNRTLLQSLALIRAFPCQVLAMLLCRSSYYLLENYKRSSLFFSETNITLPAVLAIACAVVLTLGGLLGCCISKDSPCMQGLVSSSSWLLIYVHLC